jgi:hypothetical protein
METLPFSVSKAVKEHFRLRPSRFCFVVVLSDEFQEFETW